MPPTPSGDHLHALDVASVGPSRRQLLGAGLAGLTGLGGLAFAGALSALDAAPAFAAESRTVAIPFSSDLYASQTMQRFSLVLQEGGSDGIRFVSGPRIDVRFKGPSGTWSAWQRTRLDTEGLPKGRGVYVTDAAFPEAGVWTGEARFDGGSTRFKLQLPTTPVAPVPGMAAPRAASPTAADTLGVDPICTRKPICPLHTESLSTVIGNGTPVAVLFATPALCVSAYCGPVLDELLKVRKPYEDDVQFVHVDIYANLDGRETSPTVEAWGLPSEPWFYGIDGTGTITARLDTAFGAREMRAVLDGLVRPA